MKLILKLTAAMIVAGVVLIGGCAALVGSAAESVDKEMQTQADRSAITRAQLKSVAMGSTIAQVKAKLGKPDDSQQLESEDSAFGKSKTTYLYYNVKGADWSDLLAYQLGFENGKLTSKNRY